MFVGPACWKLAPTGFSEWDVGYTSHAWNCSLHLTISYNDLEDGLVPFLSHGSILEGLPVCKERVVVKSVDVSDVLSRVFKDTQSHVDR